MDDFQLYTELAKRVDKCELSIQDLQRQDNTLAIQLAKTDTKLDNIEKMLTELKIEVGKLSGQPAKRWDTLINASIAGIVSLMLSGGALAYALTRR